jgi:hypothetical protein
MQVDAYQADLETLELCAAIRSEICDDEKKTGDNLNHTIDGVTGLYVCPDGRLG